MRRWRTVGVTSMGAAAAGGDFPGGAALIRSHCA